MSCANPGDVRVGDVELDTFLAIREGDVPRLNALLSRHPELSTSTLGSINRTPLHVVTDWPGYFPNGPVVARLLIEAGAVVDARGVGDVGETPLHWAASSDDAEVAAVLLDHGADPEAPDGSIGRPIENAVGYGCWNVARLLLTHGAQVEHLWVAAALGLRDRVAALLESGASQAELDQGLWHACAGGQRRVAQTLVEYGASLEFTPEYGHGTLIDVASSPGTQQANLVEWLEQLGVAGSGS